MKNGQVPTTEGTIYTTWWNKRSKLEKRLIIATIVSATLLLLILIVYLIISNEPEVCTTSTCVRTSMELLNYIDVKVDPCEDFYRFACGNFLLNTNLDNRSSRSVRDIMADEIQSQIRNILEQPIYSGDLAAFNLAKKFYRACMNETAIEAEGLEGMKQIFEKIGGWPTLKGTNWHESQFDWKKCVYILREIGINFEFFLILSVERAKADQTRYILNLKDPSYPFSEISNDIKNLYLEYMVDIAVVFGASKERARKEQNEVIQFLLKLAKISEESEAVNGTKLYNPMSLSELQHEFSSVPWLEYINKILVPASEITYDDVISVSSPEYLKKLLSLLKSTPKRTLANFMSWHILQHLINYLPHKILDRAYGYLSKINEKKTLKPQRWSICVAATQSRMGSTISAAYVKRYLDPETRYFVSSMIRTMKQQFKNHLLNLDWLDDDTKTLTVERVVSSVEEIASYENLIEESRFYDEVDVLEDKLLGLVLRLDYINTNIQYGKLRHRSTYTVQAQTAEFVTGLDIKYSPKENVLNIPVGLFHGLLYQRDRPDYMNYGALGAIIVHEIYHIIIEAKYRNLQGELRSWWSSRSLFNYGQKLQCLSNNYGKSVVSEIEDRLNHSNARDEDMADLAGMKVSYDTYINWVQENQVEPRLPGLNYSPNQLFWISSVIYHCTKYSAQTLQKYTLNYNQSPQQIRINSILQNLDEFAFDFRCPMGSNMNPQNKCEVW